MALHTLHGGRGTEGSPAPDADDIAHPGCRRRFANDAVVDTDPTSFEFLHDPDGAVEGVGFLVAGYQERHGATVARVPSHESFSGYDHCRKARLHIGRAATVQEAVAQRRLERWRGPRFDGPAWHDVRVSGEREAWFRAGREAPRWRRMHRPEVVDLAETHPFDREAGGLDAPDEDFLATGIVG